MLQGGAGADELTGGTGADTFCFDVKESVFDTVTDFSSAAGDKLLIDCNAFLLPGNGFALKAGVNFFQGSSLPALSKLAVGANVFFDTDDHMLLIANKTAKSGGGYTVSGYAVAELDGISHLNVSDITFQDAMYL